MKPELLVSMFGDIDNFTMVKESTGDLNRMLEIKRLTNGLLPFYNGSNPLVLDALNAGASGWCTAAPCLAPQPCLDLYEAVRAGRDDDAASSTPHSSPYCNSSSQAASLLPSRPGWNCKDAPWAIRDGRYFRLIPRAGRR